MLSQAGQQFRFKHTFPSTDYSECAAAKSYEYLLAVTLLITVNIDEKVFIVY